MKSVSLLLLIFFVSFSSSYAQTELEKARSFEQKQDFKAAQIAIDSYFSTQPEQKTETLLLRYRIYHRLGNELFTEKNQAFIDTYAKATTFLISARNSTSLTSTAGVFIAQEIESRYQEWIKYGSNAFNNGYFDIAYFWFSQCALLLPEQSEALELQIYTLFEQKNWSLFFDKITFFTQMKFVQDEVFSTGLNAIAKTNLYDFGQDWAEHLETSKDSTIRAQVQAYHVQAAAWFTAKKEYSKAVYHYQKMIDLTNDEWFKISLAQLYLKMGKIKEAEFHLNKVFLPEIIQADILDYYSSVNFQLLAIKNQKQTQIDSWKINSKLNWMSGYLKGKWAFSQGNYEIASSQIQQTIDKNARFKPAIYLQAQTLFKLSSIQTDTLKMDSYLIKSIPFYELAYELDTSDSELKQVLRMLYESTGNENKLKSLNK